jgi:hypothetical protein
LGAGLVAGLQVLQVWAEQRGAAPGAEQGEATGAWVPETPARAEMQAPEPGAVQEMPPLPQVERLSAMARLSMLEQSDGRLLVSLPGQALAEPAAPESRRDNPDSGPSFRPDCR